MVISMRNQSLINMEILIFVILEQNLLCWLKFFIVIEGDKYILERKAEVLMKKEVIFNCFAFFSKYPYEPFCIVLNFRQVSIKSRIQRNALLSHPQFEAFHQGSSCLFTTGSESSILRVIDRCNLFTVLSTTRFENSLDISLIEIFINLIFNIQILSFCLKRGYCSCDCQTKQPLFL